MYEPDEDDAREPMEGRYEYCAGHVTPTPGNASTTR